MIGKRRSIERIERVNGSRPAVMSRPAGRPRGSRDSDTPNPATRVDVDVVRSIEASFASHLRMVRLDAGVSVIELAAGMGYSTDAIGAYESGRVVPSLHALIRMSLALCVPLEHLIPSRLA